MNTPIQGSAADIIKVAMVNIYRHIKTERFKGQDTFAVHDELILMYSKKSFPLLKIY